MINIDWNIDVPAIQMMQKELNSPTEISETKKLKKSRSNQFCKSLCAIFHEIILGLKVQWYFDIEFRPFFFWWCLASFCRPLGRKVQAIIRLLTHTSNVLELFFNIRFAFCCQCFSVIVVVFIIIVISKRWRMDSLKQKFWFNIFQIGRASCRERVLMPV